MLSALESEPPKLFILTGIVEPVKGGVEAGLRLGVGKAEQESFYTAADNVVRKKLEVELQADEDQQRRGRREVCCLLLVSLTAQALPKD